MLDLLHVMKTVKNNFKVDLLVYFTQLNLNRKGLNKITALNKKEQAWVDRVQKALNACPESLINRADSFTVGDPNIIIFDKNVYVDTGKDTCIDVDLSDAELGDLRFPFGVASTSG
jgi:predicted RecB family nuclease